MYKFLVLIATSSSAYHYEEFGNDNMTTIANSSMPSLVGKYAKMERLVLLHGKSDYDLNKQNYTLRKPLLCGKSSQVLSFMVYVTSDRYIFESFK